MKKPQFIMILAKFFFFGIFFLQITSVRAASIIEDGDIPVVQSALIEAGTSSPGGDLGDWLDDASSLRLRLFSGLLAPNISFIGAAGYAIDLSYSSHDSAIDSNLTYDRLVWNWFFFPQSYGWFIWQAGIHWQWVRAEIPSLDIKESSILPGVNLGIGMRAPFTKHWGFRLDARADWTVSDYEKENTGLERNISGMFTQLWAGLDYTW